MRIKLLTFRYSATLGGFDDAALREFIRDKEVLSFREHFYSVNDVPHLTCVISYQDPVVSEEDLEKAREIARESSGSGEGGRPEWRGRPDPAAGLDEAGRLLFNTFREWRARRAREEGVPPYVILTNRQLLEVIGKRAESLTALAHIEGLGAAKLRQYGKDILGLLPGTPAPPADKEPSGAAP